MDMFTSQRQREQQEKVTKTVYMCENNGYVYFTKTKGTIRKGNHKFFIFLETMYKFTSQKQREQ